MRQRQEAERLCRLTKKKERGCSIVCLSFFFFCIAISVSHSPPLLAVFVCCCPWIVACRAAISYVGLTRV